MRPGSPRKWLWAGLSLVPVATVLVGLIAAGGASGVGGYEVVISPAKEITPKAAEARAQTWAAVA